ncbi:NAD-dependent epimerase/dehydratase family protein [Cohnella nanjingensis]|uniref:NAD-dependent epimerase/dehydratase family protein n=1 Tax=Cohnella nanjingensis TaxID=1387779 RepID=A0A7X0RZD0_9BACL|nr:NAD-dependent epimerase/dehydratase family protein [Cohnella nanjingensis]MBB6674854.1 NAD-dependent epimerase/dehydratase family protein [Cohnella nanjingensis]
MKLLILGGTRFLGYHLVHAAVRSGHEVTIFHRGQTESGQLPAGVERLQGDRDGRLTALEGRRWDAVVDCSGYVPRIVRQSADLLRDAVDRYIFVSSISVYADLSRPGGSEDWPVARLADPETEEVSLHYGALKAACEETIEELLPGRTLVVRPGLIVGPQDPTDRFTYWPTRIRKSGEVLAPGHPDAGVQFIDVRDLAEWIVRMAERQRTGTFNATGPERRLSMGSFLEACNETLNGDARLVWMSDDALLAQEAGPWIEIPLWIPGEGETSDVAHMLAVNIDRALAEGLAFRPLADTIRDTAAWDASRSAEETRRAGLAPDRELQLLRAAGAEGSAAAEDR